MIYLDNNATTQVAPEVFDAMRPHLTDEWGNPSSAHALGRAARQAIELAREQVAQLIGAAHSTEIAFTSGGSESNNWAIGGFLEQNPDKRHIITTTVEHEAVRSLCEHLTDIGCEITWLEVDRNGELDLDDLRKALRPDTGIASVMMANNETGVLFPIREIGRVVRENSDAVLHVDGVQAVGKLPIDLKELPVDLFSISGHKFHSPKGVGALYIRRGIVLPPFVIGGGQEQGRRSGTEAVPNIVGLGRASQLAKEFTGHDQIRSLRDRLEDQVFARFPIAELNGAASREKRLPNTSNISFAERDGAEIMMQLDSAGICVSTGSACHSVSAQGSAVLQAMKVPNAIAGGSIRFSLGRYNTIEDIETTLSTLDRIVGNTAITEHG
jgi:cysteine desulfurase